MLRISLCLASLLLLLSRPAHAALDEVIVASAAGIKHVAIAGQTVHVRERGNLREYAGADGKIFAMKWSAAPHEGLNNLLGPYRADFEAGWQQRRRHGLNMMVVRTSTIEVVQSSHNRILRGHAFLVSRMPKGVTIHDLP